MLVVREAQLEVFRRIEEQRAVEDCAALIARSWPRDAAALGPERLRVRIRAAFRLAQDHGITERGQVFRVANAAMALADDLAPAPRHAWVTEILGDARFAPAARLDELTDAVASYLAYEAAP